MNDVKVVALVPTRGDRPKMLENMKSMMSRQTKPLHGMVIVDDKPVDPDVKDITYRYRIGLERVFEQFPDCDLVAFIEDDDWYSDTYIEIMSDAWFNNGMPNLFGIGETYYYHIGDNMWFHQEHKRRSSAFCTMVTKAVLDMSFNWPKDDYPFTDIALWKSFPGKTVKFRELRALGIKGYDEGTHFGGSGHSSGWKGYKNTDPKMEWLNDNIDEEALKFYRSL